jgi:hypothetical protein
MEDGLLIPESFAEVDGHASTALDATKEKFLHWEELKNKYLTRCNFMKYSCNWCDVMSLAIFSDMLINFIECNRKVQFYLKTLVDEDQEIDGHQRDTLELKKVIDKVN